MGKHVLTKLGVGKGGRSNRKLDGLIFPQNINTELVIFPVMCQNLDRYVKRLSRHPIIQKDVLFRVFLQEIKLSDHLKIGITFGRAIGPLSYWFTNTLNR